MGLPEKTDRNIKIFLDKMGYKKLGDTKPSLTPLTYRQLIQKYDLSQSAIQNIIKRYRTKHG